MSVDTRLLYQRLCKIEEGEEISYGELGALIHRDVRTAAKHTLDSARQIAQRLDRIVFVAIAGKGLKRLANEEIPVVSNTSRIKKINSQSRRWQQDLSCADYDRLSKSAQSEYNLGLSLVSAAAAISSDKAIETVQRKMANTSTGILPLASTLQAFMGDEEIHFHSQLRSTPRDTPLE